MSFVQSDSFAYFNQHSRIRPVQQFRITDMIGVYESYWFWQLPSHLPIQPVAAFWTHRQSDSIRRSVSNEL